MNSPILQISVNLTNIQTLTYELFQSEDVLNQTIYSLQITYNTENTLETDFLEDISRNKEQATDIAFLFAKETVTPDTAHIIMEEMLSVWSFQK